MAILVYTILRDSNEAKVMADRLLSGGLIACANIFPVQSRYRIDGMVERADEVAVFLQTKKENFSKIKEAIKSMSTYKLPCVIAFNIDGGDKKFIEWIEKSVEED